MRRSVVDEEALFVHSEPSDRCNTVFGTYSQVEEHTEFEIETLRLRSRAQCIHRFNDVNQLGQGFTAV